MNRCSKDEESSRIKFLERNYQRSVRSGHLNPTSLALEEDLIRLLEQLLPQKGLLACWQELRSVQELR